MSVHINKIIFVAESKKKIGYKFECEEKETENEEIIGYSRKASHVVPTKESVLFKSRSVELIGVDKRKRKRKITKHLSQKH